MKENIQRIPAKILQHNLETNPFNVWFCENCLDFHTPCWNCHKSWVIKSTKKLDPKVELLMQRYGWVKNIEKVRLEKDLVELKICGRKIPIAITKITALNNYENKLLTLSVSGHEDEELASVEGAIRVLKPQTYDVQISVCKEEYARIMGDYLTSKGVKNEFSN